MEYDDKKLTCRDCNNEFVWSSGEQKFYAEKGFENEPSRCPDCRKAFKDNKKRGGNQTEITCKKCGNKGTVPFQPRNPDDILCSDCFEKEK